MAAMPHPHDEEKPEYNSTQERLKLPEYGRLVQAMVEHALTIENRQERNIYARTIASVMMRLSPQTAEATDFRQKIWDNLAYIADYKLDVDYPYPITQRDPGKRPDKLAYPGNHIRLRHYGHLIETAIERMTEMADDPQRDTMVRLVANRMKRNLADWKGDGADDTKVARDIAFYTEGQIVPNFSGPNRPLMKIGENRFRTRKNKGFA